MIQITDKVYAVEVPQDKTCKPEGMTFANFYPHASKEVDEIIWIKCNGNSFTQKIPPGSWRYLFTTKTATEEDARRVVLSSEWYFPDGHTRYVDYAHPYDTKFKQQWGIGFGTALESLASLLRSKGLDDKRNYSLIEKQGTTNDTEYN